MGSIIPIAPIPPMTAYSDFRLPSPDYLLSVFRTASNCPAEPSIVFLWTM